MAGLTRYIAQRLVLTVPMVFILVSVVFLVLRIMPGDPVLAMLGGRNVSPELIAQKPHEMELDKPLHIQYVEYSGDWCAGTRGAPPAREIPWAKSLCSAFPPP